MIFAGMMLVGLLVDVAMGWPKAIYARIGHPVTWLGRLIDACETQLISAGIRGGILTVVVVVAAAAVPAWLIQWIFGPAIWLGIFAWPLIAIRSMHDHVAAVAVPLARGDLTGARQAVAMIVGRDPAQLDTPAIARAATESLAENTSDGIVAPIFWGVVAGLPGIAAYKAVNTMDSMIGHRNARYERFGKPAALLDDVVNWVPARLTGLLFALVSTPQALNIMGTDAPHHRSPNAGWPEAAMAGALGIRLSGPRVYGDRIADEPWLNGAAPDPTPHDLTRALVLYHRAMVLLAVALLVLAVV